MEVIVTSREELKQLISDSVAEALRVFQPQIIEQPQPDDKPLTTAEAEAYLGKSRQTLTKWRKAGIIKARTLGGRCYYLKSELIAALKGGRK